MSHAARARLTLIFVCGFTIGFTTASDARGKEEGESLPRSFYVPIEFELCEHLHNAVLYQGGQAVSHMPAKRIFQFTYYPKLGRVEPVRTDVEVKGVRDDGEPFLARLAVTPWGVFTANKKVELDLDAQLARLKYKIDVRYDPMPLTLACDDRCEKDNPAATTARNETGADTIRE